MKKKIIKTSNRTEILVHNINHRKDTRCATHYRKLKKDGSGDAGPDDKISVCNKTLRERKNKSY